MKKLKQAIILTIFIIAIILYTNQTVLAVSSNKNIDKYITMVDFSDSYKQWIELSQNEKDGLIQPKIYDELDTPYIIENPIYQVKLVGTSLKTKYSLQDVIHDNVAIRNQYDTQTCWAFAGLSSLETNLALKNYKTGINRSKVYDFSEKHANYATSRMFLNNQINDYGFDRTAKDGGQWPIIENYLINGQGAVEEKDMPFSQNCELIDIKELEEPTVKTRVYDTIYFDNYNNYYNNERIEEMNKIKQHIQDYGSIFATIHGNSSDVNTFSCYNNDTGAKYCNNQLNHGIDHAVSIIGWDDDYDINNFAGNMKPSQKGAWIIRNSWGDKLEYDLDEFKQEIFNLYREQCIARGWNSARRNSK